MSVEIVAMQVHASAHVALGYSMCIAHCACIAHDNVMIIYRIPCPPNTRSSHLQAGPSLSSPCIFCHTSGCALLAHLLRNSSQSRLSTLGRRCRRHPFLHYNLLLWPPPSSSLLLLPSSSPPWEWGGGRNLAAGGAGVRAGAGLPHLGGSSSGLSSLAFLLLSSRSSLAFLCCSILLSVALIRPGVRGSRLGGTVRSTGGETAI